MNLLTDLWHQMASRGALRVRSALTVMAFGAAVGLCLLAASIFALQAVHGALRPLVGSVGASALMAMLLLIVALALALRLSFLRARMAASVPLPAPIITPRAAPDLAAAAPDLGTSAAFLAGFLLARRLF